MLSSTIDLWSNLFSDEAGKSKYLIRLLVCGAIWFIIVVLLLTIISPSPPSNSVLSSGKKWQEIIGGAIIAPILENSVYIFVLAFFPKTSSNERLAFIAALIAASIHLLFLESVSVFWHIFSNRSKLFNVA